MAERRITIEDIAQKANVSISTVSRVLRKSSGVTAPKREAVLQAVADLDYRPNVFAQSLASGQSMTIGVITQNFGSPFYDGILAGILQGLENSDYSALFADGRWDRAIERRALETFTDRRVDGLIFVGGQLSEAFLAEVGQKIPTVVVARELVSINSNCIFADNFKAAYELTNYLIEAGHRNIAHITAKMHYQEAVTDVEQRLRGYKQALVDAGLSPNPRLIVEGNLQEQSGALAIEMLLMEKQTFSAIFAANDAMALGARLGLYRRGFRVPDDVSLVGFDDEVAAAFMVPPLTTVRQPAIAMGKATATAVLDLINGKTVTNKIFESQLIVRESVARIR
ncbi:LacI family DNA-binding transcriptional regulator [Candidatus Leptofilum sp.]|uniref:LacI family DNA-binding transcriptional regulator n=1 Tax=Candidatus Leptofilum sp. TaxID=3241576 RepID=UPI003B5CDEA3